jgi:hypothetical protein
MKKSIAQVATNVLNASSIVCNERRRYIEVLLYRYTASYLLGLQIFLSRDYKPDALESYVIF